MTNPHCTDVLKQIDPKGLRKLAEAALDHSDAIGEDEWYSADENMSIFAPNPDLTFIAAANPAAILALLDRLERAEAMVSMQREALDITGEVQALSMKHGAEAAAWAVPEGYVLVPWNPDMKQVLAGQAADIAAYHVADIYTAMIAAAPSAPVAAADNQSNMQKVHIATTPPAPQQDAGKDACDAARYRWLAERFTGYDFYWGGKPDADTEEGKGKCVIVFEVGVNWQCGRDFWAPIDRAIATSKEGA